jgi:hypothetical protein
MPKLCIACKNEIHKDAVKCKECGGYQNWRRYLDFSNTVLALMLALLSVSTVAVPVFVKAFHKGRSDVTLLLREAAITSFVSVPLVGSDGVSVDSLGLKMTCLVTNSGEKSGFIEAASFKMTKGGSVVGTGQFRIGEPVVPPSSFRIQTMDGGIQIQKEDIFPVGAMSRAKPPKIVLDDIEITVRIVQNNLAPKEIVFHRRGEEWTIVL